MKQIQLMQEEDKAKNRRQKRSPGKNFDKKWKKYTNQICNKKFRGIVQKLKRKLKNEKN